MNARTKALGISFGFHALMALLAMTVVSINHAPKETMTLPLSKMVLVTLSDAAEPSPLPSQSLPPQPAPAPKARPVVTKMPVSSVIPAPSAPTTLTAAAVPTLHQGMSQSTSDHPVSAERTAAAAPAQPIAAAAPAQTKPAPKADLAAELQAFKTALRSKIQQNLRYPAAARRRGMEGEVDIRFVLETSGSIRDIAIRNGESIFHDAARLAVASASGMKVPDALASRFPDELSLTLEFRLN